MAKYAFRKFRDVAAKVIYFAKAICLANLPYCYYYATVVSIGITVSMITIRLLFFSCSYRLFLLLAPPLAVAAPSAAATTTAPTATPATATGITVTTNYNYLPYLLPSTLYDQPPTATTSHLFYVLPTITTVQVQAMCSAS